VAKSGDAWFRTGDVVCVYVFNPLVCALTTTTLPPGISHLSLCVRFYRCATWLKWATRGSEPATCCGRTSRCAKASIVIVNRMIITVFFISHVIQLTPQQQSAEPRNSAGDEALAPARRPKTHRGRRPGRRRYREVLLPQRSSRREKLQSVIHYHRLKQLAWYCHC